MKKYLIIGIIFLILLQSSAAFFNPLEWLFALPSMTGLAVLTGGTSGSEEYCSGTPSLDYCQSVLPDDCPYFPGCELNGQYCEAKYYSCSQVTNEYECEHISGCDWIDGSTPVPTATPPTPTATPTATPSTACNDDWCLSISDCEWQNRNVCGCEEAITCKYSTLSGCKCYYFDGCDNTQCPAPDCFTSNYTCEYNNKSKCGNTITKTECDYNTKTGCYEFTGCVMDEGSTGNQCSDGTSYGACSNTKPKYCENGFLVNKCTECGCNSGYLCNSTNELCALIVEPTATPTANTTPMPDTNTTPTPPSGNRIALYEGQRVHLWGENRYDNKRVTLEFVSLVYTSSTSGYSAKFNLYNSYGRLIDDFSARATNVDLGDHFMESGGTYALEKRVILENYGLEDITGLGFVTLQIDQKTSGTPPTPTATPSTTPTPHNKFTYYEGDRITNLNGAGAYAGQKLQIEFVSLTYSSAGGPYTPKFNLYDPQGNLIDDHTTTTTNIDLAEMFIAPGTGYPLAKGIILENYGLEDITGKGFVTITINQQETPTPHNKFTYYEGDRITGLRGTGVYAEELEIVVSGLRYNSQGTNSVTFDLYGKQTGRLIDSYTAFTNPVDLALQLRDRNRLGDYPLADGVIFESVGMEDLTGRGFVVVKIDQSNPTVNKPIPPRIIRSVGFKFDEGGNTLVWGAGDYNGQELRLKFVGLAYQLNDANIIEGAQFRLYSIDGNLVGETITKEGRQTEPASIYYPNLELGSDSPLFPLAKSVILTKYGKDETGKPFATIIIRQSKPLATANPASVIANLLKAIIG